MCESIWWIDRKLQIRSIHRFMYKCTCSNHFNFLECWMPKIPNRLSILSKRSQKKQTYSYSYKCQRKQRALFRLFFFNYLLENILHQLTVKSKRCNVNHKRFSAQLKSIERKMYHFVILSSLMSFFLYFKVSMCGIVVQWHVLTHMFHWSLVQDFLAKNFTFNFEFTALKHFSYSK